MRNPFTILSIATALVSIPLLAQSAPHRNDKNLVSTQSYPSGLVQLKYEVMHDS